MRNPGSLGTGRPSDPSLARHHLRIPVRPRHVPPSRRPPFRSPRYHDRAGQTCHSATPIREKTRATLQQDSPVPACTSRVPGRRGSATGDRLPNAIVFRQCQCWAVLVRSRANCQPSWPFAAASIVAPPRIWRWRLTIAHERRLGAPPAGGRVAGAVKLSPTRRRSSASWTAGPAGRATTTRQLLDGALAVVAPRSRRSATTASGRSTALLPDEDPRPVLGASLSNCLPLGPVRVGTRPPGGARRREANCLTPLPMPAGMSAKSRPPCSRELARAADKRAGRTRGRGVQLPPVPFFTVWRVPSSRLGAAIDRRQCHFAGTGRPSGPVSNWPRRKTIGSRRTLAPPRQWRRRLTIA